MTDFMPTPALLQTGPPVESSVRPHSGVAAVWQEQEPVYGQLAPPAAMLVPILPQSVVRAPMQYVAAPEPAMAIPRVAARPLRDPLSWTLCKHVCQFGIITLAVGFAAVDGIPVITAFMLAAAALLLMLSLVVADRMRFLDADPGMQIVEFVMPQDPHARQRAEHLDIELQQHELALQMAATMPVHVSVT